MTTTKWKIDPVHSEIGFKVRHMMLTNVSGQFLDFEGSLHQSDGSFDAAEISFTGEVGSLTTGNADRDAHLLSVDFFDTEQFPKMAFISKSFTKISDVEFLLKGDFTLHGVTKAVRLQAEFEGVNDDPWGNTRAGFNFSGKLNRKDWGLTWNSLLETGGVMVGEEVILNIQLQFIKT